MSDDDTPDEAIHQEFTLRLPDGTEQGVAVEDDDRDKARSLVAELYPGLEIVADPSASDRYGDTS